MCYVSWVFDLIVSDHLAMAVQQVEVDDSTLICCILKLTVTIDLSHRLCIAMAQARQYGVSIMS